MLLLAQAGSFVYKQLTANSSQPSVKKLIAED
jgi:hypothetical protein